MPNQPKTPKQQFRMDLGEWQAFGEIAGQLGTDRSDVIRVLIQGWMRRKRRELAKAGQ